MTGQKEWFNLNNRQPPFLGKLLELQVRVLGENLYFSSVLGKVWLFFAKIFILITFKKKRRTSKKGNKVADLGLCNYFLRTQGLLETWG